MNKAESVETKEGQSGKRREEGHGSELECTYVPSFPPRDNQAARCHMEK